MRDLLLVGGGSFIGGVCRYCLGTLILQHISTSRFPLGTLLVNFLGCLLIGILGALNEYHQALSAQSRLFLMTGVLGGFTTFSAFGLETISLIRADNIPMAMANVAISVLLCLVAVWLGFLVVEVL